jgi:LacI family transcriptional regulator
VDDVTGPFCAYISRGVEQQASADGRLCNRAVRHRAS